MKMENGFIEWGKDKVVNKVKYVTVAGGLAIGGGVVIHSVDCVTEVYDGKLSSKYCQHNNQEPRISEFPSQTSMTSTTTIPQPSGTYNLGTIKTKPKFIDSNYKNFAIVRDNPLAEIEYFAVRMDRKYE